ncbi:MAG: hypothetical protein ACMG6H_07670 [Acidobacteriota bacterium]
MRDNEKNANEINFGWNLSGGDGSWEYQDNAVYTVAAVEREYKDLVVTDQSEFQQPEEQELRV